MAKQLGVSSHKPSLSTIGDIGVNEVGTGNDKQIFFEYLGPNGVIKSDYIPVKNIDYIKPVKASAMVDKMKELKVVLASTINSGNPVAGQDYVLRIEFTQFYGMSDEDTYVKDAAVHVTAAMEADKKEFYKAMVAALNKAFSREIGATKTSNPYVAFSAGTPTSEDGIYILEKEQDWHRGIGSYQRVYFNVYPTTIYTGGDDVIWGTVTDLTSGNTTVGTDAVGNGKKMADLEWFCMGERGDQYRGMGYPNYIPTEYMVDPALQYNVLEIHFAFTDTGTTSYRSEKDITIAVPLSDTSGGGGATIYDDINAIIDEVEYHTGLTIAGLSD